MHTHTHTYTGTYTHMPAYGNMYRDLYVHANTHCYHNLLKSASTILPFKIKTTNGSFNLHFFDYCTCFSYLFWIILAQSVKNLLYCRKAGDAGSILRWGRAPGGGDGNPVQYPYLGNPMDRGAWQATVHGVARVRHNLATKPPPTTTFQVRGEETS